MLIFLLSAFVTSLMFHADVPIIVAKISLPFHQACLAFSPVSNHMDAYQAIVCGANLPPGDLANSLRQAGLLHLIVVSGSHLLLLEHVLIFQANKFKLLNSLIFFVLLGFVLTTRDEPPAVRAFISLLLRSANHSFKLGWSDLQIMTLSGFVSLTFCLDWGRTHSLLLSWGASLSLGAFSTFTPPFHKAFSRQNLSSLKLKLQLQLKKTALRQIAIYLLLFPLLIPFSAPHPVSILCNLLFTPILNAVLFPMSLLAFAFRCLRPIVDHLWNIVCYMLLEIAPLLPDGLEDLPIPVGWLWSYLLTLNAIALIGEVWHRRSNHGERDSQPFQSPFRPLEAHN